MGTLEFGLTIVGMPQGEIAETVAALPVLSSILEEGNEVEPIIEQMRPHIAALIPLIVQAWPIIAEKMWPQIVAETPLAQELVAFIKTKSG